MSTEKEKQTLAHVLAQLRPYQLAGVDLMKDHSRWLVCDDMGLGKTVTCLTSFFSKTDWKYNRALILCGSNAAGVWEEELHKWFGMEATIYHGTPAQRHKIWEQFENNRDHKFLITTYAMLKEIPKGWDAVFADEYHMYGLMNYKTQTAKLFEKQMVYFNQVFLITGTPVRQGVIDLFFPLHLLDCVKFKNYWSFVNTYCVTTQTPFGKQIERNPRDINGFRTMLHQHMLRRLKTDVLKDLPGKQRNVVPVEMTAKQLSAYESLKETMLYEGSADESLVMAQNQMVADLKLRQLLVCPRLLGIDDDGAGFAYLTEVVPDLLRAGRPVTIFTPFREAITLLEDLIQGWKGGTKVYKLMGGMTPAAFSGQWQAFQSPQNKNKVLLCVIKSSSSFHATEAADGFFLGYEWDFNLNVQAEDRMCRIGQQNFVNCNYILHKGYTVDEAVKNRLNEKQLAADWIIGSDQMVRELWRKVRNTTR